MNACCAIFFCTCGSFGLQNIFQARKRQLVSHCESSKFVLSFFLFFVLIFCLVMRNDFLWLLSVFSLKKSVEVHFSKLKIILLHFYDTYGANLWENTFGRSTAYSWRPDFFVEVHHFMKKNKHSWRLSNTSKTFLNQWESMGFRKLYWIF